ncbi:MAG TPA: MarR family transcriptional regulator [Gemmataceae bacterium]|jgi:DNA-binding MarR family transcriptional regulator|nr:MarR family transcriptional regulator [Gemmataceae bacterium]
MTAAKDKPDSCVRAKPDGPQVRTWVQLVRAYQRIARRLEQALDERGLSLSQFEVLAHVHFGSGITQSELAERLLVTKGNVCGLIDRLEAAGLVVRRSDPADRRANRLFLTPAGEALLAATLPTHLAIIEEMLGGLRGSELKVLHDQLERVADRAEATLTG